MSEAQQTQMNAFSALKLGGSEKDSAFGNTPSDDARTKVPFSNELQRARDDVRQQSQNSSVNQTSTPGTQSSDVAKVNTAKRNTTNSDTDKQQSVLSTDHAERDTATHGEETTHLADRQIRIGDESVIVAETVVDSAPRVESERVQMSLQQSAQIVESQDALKPVDSEMTGSTAPLTTEISQRSSSNAKDDASRLASTPTPVAIVNAKAVSSGELSGSESPPKGVNNAELLAVTSSKSGTAGMNDAPGTTKPVSEKQRVINTLPEDSVGMTNKTDSLPRVSSVLPQTVAELPAAASLHAPQQQARTVKDGVHLSLASSVSTPTRSIKTLSSDQSMLPTDLLRSQARHVETVADTAATSGASPVTREPPNATPSVSSHPATLTQLQTDLVQADTNQRVVATVGQVKQPLQNVSLLVQVVESMGQNTSVTLSDTTNNMFQALPSGIITAPVVARGELANNPIISAPYTVPLMSTDADEALAGNLKWMVADGVKNAVVNIAPSGMGPISVKIDIENEQMNVSIIASHGGTREALDAMLPRLREQLASQSIDTVRVDVSDGRSDNSRQTSGQQFAHARGDLNNNGNNNNGSASDSQRQSTDQASSDDERQRATDVPLNAMGVADADRHGQNLYDAYV